MRRRFRTALTFAALAVTAALTLAACSKKDNPTAPPVGGGGPSFDFSFPTVGTTHVATFPNAGTFDYHCRAHSSMTGVVIVSTGGASTASVDVGAGGSVFSPNSVTIAPGGTVTWSLPTGAATNHTATR